ncbi:prolyl oligopeptidase family serine peptidase [Stigmatella aurantiaca]|uniref:Prolyl-oligopeptidase n=1 Tax=Stigmatella aurantiaca (strain DW4/3-1) TaxID=378806 RepID=Q094I0_STIAD|nr:prolyl oligopeptidase family serine peptidase [Stigmatella aurantiaca]ADO68630.1 Prolyl oligopeptidase [Stigmatella aurantiaca DW4/3-1]EAU67170.1 prolyl-oligopeptidase [Stigmatella aurantiaca DW4/3-1]
MRHFTFLAALAAWLGVGSAAVAADEDPYLWLEDVEGPRALDQVRQWNASTAAILEKAPGFEAYRTRGAALLNDTARIAFPDAVQNDRVVNFWQDASHVRGLWRVASLDGFIAGQPEWRTLIDLDALAKSEGKNWVWKGALCLRPAYDRCLIALSDGGKDAHLWREFDTVSGQFVEQGFVTPVAKNNVSWLDRDTLLIRSDYGPGTLTTAGYGRQVRRWKRGTPLAEAPVVFEAHPSDVWAVSMTEIEEGNTYPLIQRDMTVWTSEFHHLTPDGKLVRSPLPADAEVEGVLQGRLIARLYAHWKHGGKTYKAGSLVAYAIAPLLEGKAPGIETVYQPSASEAIEEVALGKQTVYVKLLDNVAGKLVRLTRGAQGRWTPKPVPLAAKSVIHLVSVGGSSDMAFASVEGLTAPEALFSIQPGAAPVQIAALPARFDASKMEVLQRFATSKDGTRIPYFVVRPKGVKGPVPALMHAYGGFRVATSPTYLSKNPLRLGPLAQFWVEEGNAFVLANIRGGGEFGPRWHESVLKANRQKAYDDFHAVAEDLFRTGITKQGSLGISGRSNGGLLVGVAYTQRPELYSAVLMGVPLADMKRYSHLLAGASWMGEYGDPDKPEEWAFISKYSPYQNLKKGAAYPKVMFYTSTKDDRVHPAHARKMAARMAELGHPFYYYENIDGGHAGSANHNEEAYRAALMMAYLNRELRGIDAPAPE